MLCFIANIVLSSRLSLCSLNILTYAQIIYNFLLCSFFIYTRKTVFKFNYFNYNTFCSIKIQGWDEHISLSKCIHAFVTFKKYFVIFFVIKVIYLIHCVRLRLHCSNLHHSIIPAVLRFIVRM